MNSAIVTGVGGPAGKALTGQLTDAGWRVVGADMAALAPPYDALLDEFHQIPAAAHPSFLPVLAQLVARSGAQLCIPTVQEELPVLASAASCLDVAVVIAPTDAVARAQDKLTTSWTLRQAGVAVPDFCAAEDIAGQSSGWWGRGGRFVVKPRFSRGGRGVQVVEEAGDLGEIAAQSPGGIVQQFAPGTEYSPQVYRAPSGGAIEVIVLEKTALKEGLVGNAAAVLVVDGPSVADVARLAREAVLAMGLTGPVDLDIRRLADGTPVVLEINARFGANSASAPSLLHRVLADYAPRSAREGVA
ncbi:MAG: ATP-grasp domain-containing protein [Dermatophilaceae bacterium]